MKLPVIPWYADGLAFTCTQCGNCCTGGPGYVWLSDAEIDRFAVHLRLDRKVFLKTYCRSVNGGISLKERRTPANQYDCVFLTLDPTTGKRGCSVYPVRPLQCRTWPFWDGNLASKQNWKAAKKICPGMDQGKPYALERIEALRTVEDWPENPPSSE